MYIMTKPSQNQALVHLSSPLQPLQTINLTRNRWLNWCIEVKPNSDVVIDGMANIG